MKPLSQRALVKLSDQTRSQRTDTKWVTTRVQVVFPDPELCRDGVSCKLRRKRFKRWLYDMPGLP